MSENAKKHLTPREAAEVIGKSLDWITRARAKKGKGPPFYKIGGSVQYDPEELAAWRLSHRHT